MSGVFHVISMSQAIDIVLSNTGILDTVEADLSAVYGSVLAEDVRSDIDMPPFDKSAMDGFAVKASLMGDPPVILRVDSTVAAGETYEGGAAGSGNGTDTWAGCVRIMTGAPVPEGLDSVVKIEETEGLPDGKVRFTEKVVKGQNICFRGEDVRRGDVVLETGMRVRGPEIAALASVGRHKPRVYRRPAVGVLSTGKELVEPRMPPGQGKIRNSNGPMLTSLAASTGCETEYFGIADDDENSLRRFIRRGFEKDILLLSGGVSVGDYDLVPGVLKNEGAEILFHKVFLKPGKPLLFAKKEKCVIFGVPGNPVSNFTTFSVFIRPVIYRMMGREDHGPDFIEGFITEDFANTSSRLLLAPSSCVFADGRYEVTPHRLNGSADIAGCANSSCIMMIEKGFTEIKKGEKVKILLFGD
jgi:molybdopterin molybdotransferase